MAGSVYVNGQKETKAGDTFADECDIVVKDEKPPFVSRGGLKLDKAVKVFNIDLNGLVCMDIEQVQADLLTVCFRMVQ